MVVTSPTISITVLKPPEYALSIGVTPEAGYIGDPFTFRGILTVDGGPMPGIVTRLVLEGVGVVGEDVTGPMGDYEIVWIADRAGVLKFHAEAPGLEVRSEQLTLQIPPVTPEWWWIAAVGGSVCIAMVTTAIVAEELRKKEWM